MTEPQMAWCVRRGFAWADPDNAGGPADTYWTRDGGWQWDVARQAWEMVF